MAKVNHKENICFIKEKHIHEMHIAIRPIVKAFENLQKCFLKAKDDLITLKKPLENFKVVKIGSALKYATEENCPYLYKKGGSCEVSAFDLTDEESITTTPTCKKNEELIKLLCMENTPFLEKIPQLTKVKAIWKVAIGNPNFKSELKHTSINDVFNATKKGSRNYKKILLSNQTVKNAPAETICTNWNIAAKYEKEDNLKSVFTFWKNPYLPSYLQNLHLQIINHKLKLNVHLKHFARDENNQRISGDCTFCRINNIVNPSEESFNHLFLECASSINALTPMANKFNIPLPDLEEKGEKVLYYFYWTEMRTNMFYIIYKYYINNCRLRKTIPTSQQFERTVRYETKKNGTRKPNY
jgi:hypothetical protein